MYTKIRLPRSDARIEDLLQPDDTGRKDLPDGNPLRLQTCTERTTSPPPNGNKLLWKDGIGAIDEHLNGFQQWGLPPIG